MNAIEVAKRKARNSQPTQFIYAVRNDEKSRFNLEILNDIELDLTNSQKSAIYKIIQNKHVLEEHVLVCEINKCEGFASVVLTEAKAVEGEFETNLEETVSSILTPLRQYFVFKGGRIETK